MVMIVTQHAPHGGAGETHRVFEASWLHAAVFL
jgi:hypothetical protein